MKTNAYGAEIGRNGYAPSIMQPARTCCCYLCGKPGRAYEMDRHEPFGAANRQKSKELGLWVELHHWGCHEGPGSVHGGNGEAARQLRKDAQTAAMLRFGWSRERWIAEFGKSELTEAECERLTAPAGKAAPPTVPPSPSEERHGNEPERRRGKKAGDIIRELWPDHATTFSGAAPGGGLSGFMLLNDPDMPF